jgi:hypothetical protein
MKTQHQAKIFLMLLNIKPINPPAYKPSSPLDRLIFLLAHWHSLAV